VNIPSGSFFVSATPSGSTELLFSCSGFADGNSNCLRLSVVLSNDGRVASELAFTVGRTMLPPDVAGFEGDGLCSLFSWTRLSSSGNLLSGFGREASWLGMALLFGMEESCL